MNRHNIFGRNLLLGAASAALFPGAVSAAQPDATASTPVSVVNSEDLERSDDAIFITGTSLRGIAPAGAETIGLNEQQIAATQSVSTVDLLSNVPQLFAFNSTPVVAGKDNIQLTVNRTNVRNLPQGIGGGSPTLVLIDGRRLVGSGVGQTYPDPDVIPPGLIQRVEIVTDGGSAVYGSDAIGGVVNFITRRDYHGIEASIRQGIGDDYNSTVAQLTAGYKWDSGSVFAAYNFSTHDSIYGFDRDYVRLIDWNTGIPLGRTCNPANVAIGADTWAVTPGSPSSLTPGLANACDLGRSVTIYPKENRHSVMAGFRQEIVPSLTLEARAWYMHRKNISDGGPHAGTSTVTSGNPNYVSTGGATANSNQVVFFDFSPFRERTDQVTTLETWGITPTITWDISNDWQMRTYYNYGHSDTTANIPLANNSLLNTFVSSGAINPYNVIDSDPAAIDQVFDWVQFGRGIDRLHNAKVTFDGPVFTLPGGDLRVAAGAEYIDEKYRGVIATNTNAIALAAPFQEAKRDVKSAFAEVNIPLVGPDNRMSFIHSFNVSGAVRYDDYSDFGTNWSPSFGATLKPVEWFALRGRWNKAFQAPSLADLANANSTLLVLPFVPAIIQAPNDPAGPTEYTVAAQGTKLPLDPQKATAYNIGFDLSPPPVPGLDIHFSYYNINYKGQIGTPPVFNPSVFYPNFPNNYILHPQSVAQVRDFMLAAGVPAGTLDNALAAVPADAVFYIAADVRRQNLGVTKVSGLDLGIDYQTDVSWGKLYGTFNGTYLLKAKNAISETAPFAPSQAGINGSRTNFTATLGTLIGENFRAQATLNYSAGFDVDPILLTSGGDVLQSRVGAFTPIDLYFQYDIDNASLPPITLSLGISNVLDEDPPIYRGAFTTGTNGYAGSTLGRVFQFGATLKFDKF